MAIMKIINIFWYILQYSTPMMARVKVPRERFGVEDRRWGDTGRNHNANLDKLQLCQSHIQKNNCSKSN